MSAILRVMNLSIFEKKAGNRLLTDISFNVHRGETVGIIGGSGSGKTLLCRAILNLLDKNTFHIEGSVLFEERNLLALPDSTLNTIRGKQIALIMQNPMTAFDPVSRIKSQMVETIQLHHRLPKKAIASVIQQKMIAFGLSDTERILHSFPCELSGGMLQRLMIILTLLLSPDIIIADEITTALDTKTQAAVLAECMRIKKTGIPLLIVTHHFGVLAAAADRVLVLHNGALVESGSIYTVFNSPQTSYTKALLHARSLKGDSLL